jgi:hypothetical protein
MKHFMAARCAPLLAAACLLAACAHHEDRESAIKDSLETARVAIENAHAAHVEDYAAPKLREAEATYKKAANAGDVQSTRDLALEAAAQADLASADARDIRAQANKASVIRQIQSLDRMSKPGGKP